jgi:FtsP/CotA-like multicopper oxidase with cupredoxin domain
MDPRPILTMTDMGMGNMDASGNMSGMAMGQPGGAASAPSSPPTVPMDHGSMAGMNMGPGSMPGMAGADASRGSAPTPPKPSGHGAKPAAGMNMAGGSMAGMDMGSMDMPLDPTAKRMQGTPGVDNVAMMPTERLHEAGSGLDGNGRRVLTYADLRATQPGDDPRPPSREILLHLTGNMSRYMWGFDGKKFSEAEPIRLKLNERVRFVLINDTMMNHPIHLHGLWSELDNGQGAFRPYKHTIIVKPGEKLSYLVMTSRVTGPITAICSTTWRWACSAR